MLEAQAKHLRELERRLLASIGYAHEAADGLLVLSAGGNVPGFAPDKQPIWYSGAHPQEQIVIQAKQVAALAKQYAEAAEAMRMQANRDRRAAAR